MPEYLFTASEADIAYPKKDLNTGYRTFTICGVYSEKPVCLSFHMYSDIGADPLNVLVIMTSAREKKMKVNLASSLTAFS